MASVGLLLLLSVSSSFLLCGLSLPHEKTVSLQKRGEKVNKAVGYFLKIATAAKPFIGLIPEVGNYINIIIDFTSAVAGESPETKMLAYIKTEFENLNLKIDKNQKESLWHTWIKANYEKEEKEINISWKKLVELTKSCSPPCIEELKNKKGIEDILKRFFKNVEKTLMALHFSITDRSKSDNFEKLLTDHVRCIEKHIKLYTANIAMLTYKGIIMTQFYDSLKGIDTDEKSLAEKAYETSSAMFQIQKKCIQNPDEYVKLHVMELIDEKKARKLLAKEIREFLDRTYDRYNWIVVCYLTKYSAKTHVLTKWRNRHIVKKFMTVSKGEVSVAVARQAKGTHTKASKVKQALEKCLKSVSCDKVEEKLEKCDEKVDGIPVEKTYSVAHAYFHKEHGSVHAVDSKEAPQEVAPDADNETPYFYKSKCSINAALDGHLKILIKSDEEIMKEDPCKKVDCGGEERGKCVNWTEAWIGMCECNKNYYGENCEESLEDYKKKLSETIFKS